MCRLLVFKGVEPITLSNLVTKPAHSIINQAFDARLRLDATRSVNGDGFGLGWYDAESSLSGIGASHDAKDSDMTAGTGFDGSQSSHPQPRDGLQSSHPQSRDGISVPFSDLELEDEHPLEASRSSAVSPPPSHHVTRSEKTTNPEAPCIFTSVTPAWNNQNLQRLCEKIRSPLVFAHIRASTSGALSETNCHPWRFGRLMWMHNGQISQFPRFKRTLLSSLDDDLLNFPQGQTDSEWAFALFLSHLERPDRAEPFAWRELKSAMEATIADLNVWAKEKGVTEPSLMNFCVTDGLSILCTRYVSSLHDEAASLFFSSGTSFYERSRGLFRMRKEDRRQNIVVVASEPLTFEKADWMEVPTNTMIVVTPKMNVLQIPILDEYSPLDRPHPDRYSVSASQTRANSSQARGGIGAPGASLASTRDSLLPSRGAGYTSSSIHPSVRPPPPRSSLAHSTAHASPSSLNIPTASSPSKARSPAFALSAGFPPNSHMAAQASSTGSASIGLPGGQGQTQSHQDGPKE